MKLFANQFAEDARAVALVKRAMLALVAVHLVIGALSGYRAYVQVRSLDIRSSERTLRSGSTIQTTVVSSGRTFVDVRLELIQGVHSEVLTVHQLPKNNYAFYDPRPQRASLTLILTAEVLAQFHNGAALVRVTASGQPQWLRVPPPEVRELAVEIQHD